MATRFDYHDELNLLRRALAEPVRQFIVVEYDSLLRLRPELNEIVALNPGRASVILEFDPRSDNPIALLQKARDQLAKAAGERPPLLVLLAADAIEDMPNAPLSTRFWKEMNLAREAWDALDAQTVLCLSVWGYRLARLHADHLMSWVSMRLHLTTEPGGALSRPDQPLPSVAILGDFGISPSLARERWPELHREWQEANARHEPPESFIRRFFIPMLETALAMGDLQKAREARDAACAAAQIPDEAKPRWHELNLALSLADHEPNLANEHAHKLFDLAENHQNDVIRKTAIMAVGRQAALLWNTAHYHLAEPLMRRALAIDEKSLGLDHPNVAIRLNNLALLLQDTNRLAEAEPLIRRALVIDEKNFGPDHPSVATLKNLALLLQDTNRMVEAEPLMRRALAIDEKSLGLDHPDVATGLNNLALLLQDTNRLAEAEPLMRRALAIDEKSLGPDHPNVATGLNNLALLLQNTNRLAEAEPLMRRALAIDEKSFGPDHPKVATGLNNLALLLQDTNRLAEAEPLMRRSLAIDEKSFGPDHPEVAIRLNNLAQALQATNRLAEAEPLMRRNLVIFLKFTHATGHSHPHLKAAVENYKNLLKDLKLPSTEIEHRLAQLEQESI